DVREFRGSAVVEAFDGFEIDAKLVLTFPGGNVLVGFRIHIRVHADGGGCDFAKLPGDIVEVAELFLALYVEGVDFLFEGVNALLTGFADPREGAVGGITAGFDYTEKLASRNDVKARAFGGEQAKD